MDCIQVEVLTITPMTPDSVSADYIVLGDYDARVDILNTRLLAQVPSRAGRSMLCRVFIFTAALEDNYSI